MKITVGFVPYLNMVPFHQGFGPASLKKDGHDIVFNTCSPRVLGRLAEEGQVDAGAMSWVDFQRLSSEFEAIQPFGIGVKEAARSVLLFSKKPLSELSGVCAVTDDTSTSFRLLQVLLDRQTSASATHFHRIGSLGTYDGSSDALLLIGDEALQAARHGLKGFPVVTDLAEEWFKWQHTPFAFARWAVRKSLPTDIKTWMAQQLDESLKRLDAGLFARAAEESRNRNLPADMIEDYWKNFRYRMTSDHAVSMQRFEELATQCLSV